MVGLLAHSQVLLRLGDGYTGDLLGVFLALQEVLILLICGIYHDVVASGVQEFVLVNQVEIVSQLSVHTKDKSWTNCCALKAKSS